MAEISPSPEADDAKTFTFSVALIDYIATTKSRGPSRVKAPPKTKKLKHELTDTVDNYVKFMTGLLLEHSKKTDFIRDRKSTRLNSSHSGESRMPSSA